MYALAPGSLACLVRSGSSMAGAEGWGRLVLPPPGFLESFTTFFSRLPPLPRPMVDSQLEGFLGGSKILSSPVKLNLIKHPRRSICAYVVQNS